MSILEGSNILITGGTGSFGKAFIRYALDNLDPHRIVVFSRDELKQYEVRQLFDDDPRLRWFIGDIRDQRRLARAHARRRLRRARRRAQAGRHRGVQPVRVRPDQRRSARRTSSRPPSTPA